MVSNERTPLIQTVIIARPRQRYTHSTLRRCFTISLTTVLITVAVLFLLPVQWAPKGRENAGGFLGFLPWASPLPHKSWPLSQGLSYKELQQVLLSTPKEEKAKEWSQHYTSGPHLAGKNLSLAVWTRERWQEFGVQHASLVSYDVYLNYPVGHRLALLEKKSKSEKRNSAEGKQQTIADASYAVKYECSLEEDVLKEDETTGLKDRIPTFHGYSASGNVTAQFVYVNYGTFWDYEDLVKANVSLKGKIAIAKYGGNFRALKVQRAQELGMVGTVIYSDPGENGNITEEKGYKPYPEGPAMNPSSVQRGSTQFLNIASGDPTTPGYPSLPGVPRQDPSESMPSIPSLPISYRDALPILKALNGHGPKASDFNQYWQRGGLEYKGVEYNIGPSPSEIVLNLVNEQEYVTTPIWNVIGIINGTLPDEVIILGNHRDAWIAGGAGDPNSGSAALNELVRSFGIALQKGWKPLRSIVFASWDGEEYGLLGSTEFVEEYFPWLSKAAVAYLNVDVGVKGARFNAHASPLLKKAVYAATSLVPSANQSVPGQTVRDLWGGNVGTLGSGSDYSAFQHVGGVPSIDMGFSDSLQSPVYHYHSNYDSFAWMESFGDPGWHYHLAITKVWALIAAALVDSPVIALNITDYALGLSSYLSILRQKASESPDPSIRTLSFPAISQSINSLLNASTAFDSRAAALASSIDESTPWWKWWRKVKLYYEIREVNEKYKYFERKFLYAEGLDRRPFYKHTIFAPEYWRGYGGITFPGLRESVDNLDLEGVERWSEIIKEKIDAATESLK